MLKKLFRLIGRLVKGCVTLLGLAAAALFVFALLADWLEDEADEMAYDD